VMETEQPEQQLEHEDRAAERGTGQEEGRQSPEEGLSAGRFTP
jgi:hypothetical protein